MDSQFVAAQGGAQAMVWVLSGRNTRPQAHSRFSSRRARKKMPPVKGVLHLNRDAIYATGVAVPPGSKIQVRLRLAGKKVCVMSQRGTPAPLVRNGARDLRHPRRQAGSDVSFPSGRPKAAAPP